MVTSVDCSALGKCRKLHTKWLAASSPLEEPKSPGVVKAGDAVAAPVGQIAECSSL